MLKRIHRLVSERDFALLARSRKSAFGKTLGAKMRENRLPHSRFGIVVGLKVSKRANQRNLVKRRLREILRGRIGAIRPGFDVMIMANPSAVTADYAEIEANMTSVLKKLGLIA